MYKAIWNNTVIAESNNTINMEGSFYFPSDDVKKEYLIDSSYHTTCPWKGKASYYSIKINGKINENSAWYYPDPSEKASHIKNHIAFWKGVKVVKD